MTKIKRYDQWLAQIPTSIWLKVMQIDELKGQWVAGAKLDPQVLNRLKRSVLITSTGASTRIEGARLSDKIVERMMQGLDVQKFTDRDQQEVRGYFELLENIFNSWRSLKFSENTIKGFHKELLKYVKKDELHRGDYKKQENRVHMVDTAGKSRGILFDTTSAYLTPKEMQELVEWTQQSFIEKQHHPLFTIAAFLVGFLQIHPFQDGNGRLSRILTNLLLLKEGYLYVPYISHEKLVEDNKLEYYLALRQSQNTFKTKNEGIVPWLDFFSTIVLKQSQTALKLLSEESVESLLSEKQLIIWRYLQTVKEATPRDIVKETKITRPTVNQVLTRLLQLKRIERIGLGRSTKYKIR